MSNLDPQPKNYPSLDLNRLINHDNVATPRLPSLRSIFKPSSCTEELVTSMGPRVSFSGSTSSSLPPSPLPGSHFQFASSASSSSGPVSLSSTLPQSPAPITSSDDTDLQNAVRFMAQHYNIDPSVLHMFAQLQSQIQNSGYSKSLLLPFFLSTFQAMSKESMPEQPTQSTPSAPSQFESSDGDSHDEIDDSDDEGVMLAELMSQTQSNESSPTPAVSHKHNLYSSGPQGLDEHTFRPSPFSGSQIWPFVSNTQTGSQPVQETACPPAQASSASDPQLEAQCRKFVCADCGKRYKQKSHLIVHRRTHDGVRPFTCNFEKCTKSFVTNSALRAHLRVHSGERPYMCSITGCGRMFSTNSNLRRHERTHVSQRPHLQMSIP